MDFGAGRYWGDDGADDELDPWDPWPLENLWRPQELDLEEQEPEQDGEEVTRFGSRHVMFDVASVSEASVSLSSTEADAPPAPPPSDADAVPRRAARLDASAVHRMVSSHIVRKETKETKEAKESTDAGNLWANWAPGRDREPWHERPWGELWQEGQKGQFQGRPSGSSRPAHIRPSKPGPGETRVRISKELAESWTTREVLQASEDHLEEFDVVHLVVALHRIAKSTDFQQLRHSAPLREQLAELAKNAAEAVQPGPQGEVPHVKEVSKAVWALAKVGPWSDSMEGYAPRGAASDWGGWSSVHRSLKVLGACAMERLNELDSHGLSNVAWSFAVARQDGTTGTARAVAWTALQILPDFKAQGLANTAWAMAKLMADHEGRSEHRLLDHIAHEVARNAKDFTPQGLANIGWAFATLAMRHEALMDAVAKELAEGVGNWSQQNLANILWAFAKVMVQPRPSRAIQAVAEDVLMTLNAWSALNMANLTWAFAKLSLRHPKLFAAIERECQQKLWNFSSQNLVNVAWSFAKVLVVRRSFFEDLARCATHLAPDFNPQNCSNAVWAFAAVSHVNVELLEATARRAEDLAAELVAQDLANLSWAFAKLSRRDVTLEEAIASQVLRKVNTCSPQHLSIIAYSFAQMMAAGPGGLAVEGGLAPSATAMVEAVLDTALQRVREFDAQGLTNLAQSLAKLDMPNDAMLTALLQEAAPKISGFSNQELAMLAWALARLQRFQGAGLRMVVKETRQRLRDLTPQDVSVLVWSFARSGSKEENTAEDPGVRGKKDPNIGASMLKTLTETIMRLIPELTPQDLSTIIWGYATAGIECPDMIEAVADESVGKVATFAPQDMANVAWGLAKMGLLHEELFQVLSKDFVRRVQECQAQHLSIAAWSFAKLGLASPKLFGAIGQALAQQAQQLDPQGVGNSLWAFGVLCFWHEPFVQAVGRRAITSAADLTAQEMANVSFGLRTLLCWRRQSKDPTAAEVSSLEMLLLDFLEAASNSFCRKADHREGASWTDFANAAKAAAEESPDVDALKELEARFRRLHMDPLLEGLEKLLHGGDGALHQLQEVLDEPSFSSNVGGIPHLGEFYSAEALKRLGLAAKAEGSKCWFPGAQEVPEWIETARRQCRSEVQVWQIPATDTVVAHVTWDVSRMENSWRNEGRVYYAASQRAQARGVAAPVVPKDVEELLAPLRQHLRRDSHPERLALLELMASLQENTETQEENAAWLVQLQNCQGSVHVYVSQYPCVSCLAVFCQFRRWCPNIELEVAFDNAWSSFCGAPRNG